jgi:hypothetical protein
MLPLCKQRAPVSVLVSVVTVRPRPPTHQRGVAPSRASPTNHPEHQFADWKAGWTRPPPVDDHTGTWRLRSPSTSPQQRQASTLSKTLTGRVEPPRRNQRIVVGPAEYQMEPRVPLARPDKAVPDQTYLIASCGSSSIRRRCRPRLAARLIELFEHRVVVTNGPVLDHLAVLHSEDM